MKHRVTGTISFIYNIVSSITTATYPSLYRCQVSGLRCSEDRNSEILCFTVAVIVGAVRFAMSQRNSKTHCTMGLKIGVHIQSILAATTRREELSPSTSVSKYVHSTISVFIIVILLSLFFSTLERSLSTPKHNFSSLLFTSNPRPKFYASVIGYVCRACGFQ